MVVKRLLLFSTLIVNTAANASTIVVVVLESGEGKRESYQAAGGRYRDLQSSDSVVDSECWISQ